MFSESGGAGIVNDTDQPEMPFAYVYRIEDENALSSVREHMAEWDSDGSVHEEYTPFHEELDGENLHIVTWSVQSNTESKQ